VAAADSAIRWTGRWSGCRPISTPRSSRPKRPRRSTAPCSIRRGRWPEAAEAIYGAVLDPARQVVQAEPTAARRQKLKEDRLSRFSNRKPVKRDGTKVLELNPYIEMRRDKAGLFHACSGCGAALGPAGENWKAHALLDEQPVQVSNPLIGDPKRYIDAPVRFRRYLCAGCGAQLDTEIAVGDDAPLADTMVVLPEAAE
jgi:N-methylhydantoinase B